VYTYRAKEILFHPFDERSRNKLIGDARIQASCADKYAKL
jgi:hypothetical protein